MTLLCLYIVSGTGDAFAWGTNLDDEVRASVLAPTGPIGTGRSYSTSPDGHILFWDWDGNLINALATYLLQTDELNDIALEGDSLTSVGFTFALGTSDGLIVRTDPVANPAWLVSVGGQNSENFEALCEGYICGTTRSWGAGEDDVFLLKMNGPDLQWALAIGGSGFDRGYDVLKIGEDAIVLGLTESYGESGQVLVMRVGEDGALKWCKVVGGQGYDFGLKAALFENKIVVAGKDGSFGGGILLSVFESDGALVQSRLIRATGYEYPLGLSAGEGAIYISGKHTIGGPGFLIKTNTDGSVVWSRYIGGTASDGISSVSLTPDQIIAAGYTSSYGFGRRDFLLASLDPWGYNCAGRDAQFTSTEISLPVRDTIPYFAFVEPGVAFLQNTVNQVYLPSEIVCEGVRIEEEPISKGMGSGLYDCTGRRLISEPKRPGIYFRFGPEGKIRRLVIR